MKPQDITAIAFLPKIIDKLLQEKSVNITTEAKKYNISERTLRDNFFKIVKPIFGNELKFTRKDNNWKLIKDHHINATFITSKELVYIQKLEILSKKYHAIFPEIKDIFDKYKDMSTDIIYKKQPHERLNKKGLIKYKKIEEAILNNTVVNCTYEGNIRKIQPLKIISLDGFWYVGVFKINENKSQEYRNYILTKIEDIESTAEQGEPVTKALNRKLETAINAFFKPTNNDIEIKLEMHSKYIEFFKRKTLSPTQKVYPSASDYWYLEITVTNLYEIIPTIQQFFPHIKVIEPQELQDEIVKNITSYLKES
ncbi:WYL domain-containing protein [Sulfurospirillum sp.]|uniref:WYL domain-containing protein n=1 Tax=Sulfurospirillum sp. TaxID=2053622 RepID=UPI002FDC9F00